jgi:hypothetical protein
MKPETPLAARAAVRALTASKIRELYNEGIGRSDILAFWVGEPDEPTPQFIRQAGIDSIGAGEVFYTHNHGIPELREALASYVTRLHRPVSGSQIAVTSAGVNALMLASQLIVDPGERVVEVVPLWPNLQEIPKILGARVTTVALSFSPSGWRLDLGRLIDALTPGTRALYLNSPNNPTGWTITRDGAEGAPRALPAARHLDLRRRRLRASLLRTGWSRAFLPEARGRERPPDQRQHLFQVLAHDRVAPGLARRAFGPGGRSRQADRIQHLLCARVRPACGACRARARRAGDRTYP